MDRKATGKGNWGSFCGEDSEIGTRLRGTRGRRASCSDITQGSGGGGKRSRGMLSKKGKEEKKRIAEGRKEGRQQLMK